MGRRRYAGRAAALLRELRLAGRCVRRIGLVGAGLHGHAPHALVPSVIAAAGPDRSVEGHRKRRLSKRQQQAQEQ